MCSASNGFQASSMRNSCVQLLMTLAFVNVDELLLFNIFELYFKFPVELRSSVDIFVFVDVEFGVLGRSPKERIPRIRN